uniref:Uncharacterized protein n=1 Tax=Opuntia streptacantha TaxID=393608 RepID=A0A7C9CMC3_OPUST
MKQTDIALKSIFVSLKLLTLKPSNGQTAPVPRTLWPPGASIPSQQANSHTPLPCAAAPSPASHAVVTLSVLCGCALCACDPVSSTLSLLHCFCRLPSGGAPTRVRRSLPSPLASAQPLPRLRSVTYQHPTLGHKFK